MRPAALTHENWAQGPVNRWAFLHMDEVLPTAVISRGDGPILALEEAPPLSVPGLDDFLERTCTDGLIVLRGREVVLKRYLNGLEPATRHLLMSASKSLCAVAVGHHVATGQIDLAAPVACYLPDLGATAYGDATVQQVLDMTVAVPVATYDDPVDDRVAGWLPRRPDDPADTRAYVTTLARTGEHGRAWEYSAENTAVLGWILERVTGCGCVKALSASLWSRIGAEHDAYATVDPAGFPVLGGGLCTTLRDAARFGRVLLDDGIGADGRELVPARWLADVRRGRDPAMFAEFMAGVHPGGSYRDHFWITGDDHGSFYAAGAHGQYVWMDPAADIVIVKVSSLPEGVVPEVWADEVGFLAGLCRTFTG